MAIEVVFFVTCLVLSSVGIYLNLCYQRATHRSTVYPKFCRKNLRFLSVTLILLGCSNIVSTAAIWGSNVNHTKKSEAFFSTMLSVCRAVPAVAVFWTTVERIIFNRAPSVRETPKRRHIVVFRTIQTVVSVIMELVIRGIYVKFDDVEPQMTFVNSSDTDDVVRNSLVANYFYDFYHAALLIPCLFISIVMYNSAKASYTRACLVGGIRNEQKIQNQTNLMAFYKHSYAPLYIACLSDLFLQVFLKRCLDIENSLLDILYINVRCYLPIVYPISLIALNKNLRTDYIANFILCRKARNLHKELKVKVIATRESQESIIANLKMIGILSDMDTSHGGPANASVSANSAMGTTARPSSGMPPKASISKDSTSNTSVTSLPKLSGSVVGGAMVPVRVMFHTRPRNSSVQSIGSIG